MASKSGGSLAPYRSSWRETTSGWPLLWATRGLVLACPVCGVQQWHGQPPRMPRWSSISDASKTPGAARVSHVTSPTRCACASDTWQAQMGRSHILGPCVVTCQSSGARSWWLPPWMWHPCLSIWRWVSQSPYCSFPWKPLLFPWGKPLHWPSALPWVRICGTTPACPPPPTLVGRLKGGSAIELFASWGLWLTWWTAPPRGPARWRGGAHAPCGRGWCPLSTALTQLVLMRLPSLGPTLTLSRRLWCSCWGGAWRQTNVIKRARLVWWPPCDGIWQRVCGRFNVQAEARCQDSWSLTVIPRNTGTASCKLLSSNAAIKPQKQPSGWHVLDFLVIVSRSSATQLKHATLSSNCDMANQKSRKPEVRFGAVLTRRVWGLSFEKKWGLVQPIVWLPLPQIKWLPVPSTAWTETFRHSLRFDQCPWRKLTCHLSAVHCSASASDMHWTGGLRVPDMLCLDDWGRDCHWAENEFTACKVDQIIHKWRLRASGTCASRRMFTQFPSPLHRATACRSHDYQVTLRHPLHTFRGPGATPHGQVLLSDRFRQTLLTTSLGVVQDVIYDRVLEAGI